MLFHKAVDTPGSHHITLRNSFLADTTSTLLILKLLFKKLQILVYLSIYQLLIVINRQPFAGYINMVRLDLKNMQDTPDLTLGDIVVGCHLSPGYHQKTNLCPITQPAIKAAAIARILRPNSQ